MKREARLRDLGRKIHLELDALTALSTTSNSSGESQEQIESHEADLNRLWNRFVEMFAKATTHSLEIGWSDAEASMESTDDVSRHVADNLVDNKYQITLYGSVTSTLASSLGDDAVSSLAHLIGDDLAKSATRMGFATRSMSVTEEDGGTEDEEID